jgi:hypothetical protein
LAVAVSVPATHTEDCAAAAFNPKALAINSPSSALNARGAADLAFHSDLIGIVATAVFAIVVVGFASD